MRIAHFGIRLTPLKKKENNDLQILNISYLNWNEIKDVQQIFIILKIKYSFIEV